VLVREGEARSQHHENRSSFQHRRTSVLGVVRG
jgi:hypothetical protein